MDGIRIEIPPRCLAALSPYRLSKAKEMMGRLVLAEKIRGILVGGSLTYKASVERSDVDLFCLIQSAPPFDGLVEDLVEGLDDVEVEIYQGHFPWTEDLYTVYYKSDPDFSIDICLIQCEKGKDFFWEPNGEILLDKDGLISEYRKEQMSRPNYTKQPFLKSNPFSLALVSLKKIEKNLSRSHLWNALEQLSIMRRYVMQIIRLQVVCDSDFLGRVDRDIEDSIPKELNEALATTVANYSVSDIAIKAKELTRILQSLMPYLVDSSEGKISEWIEKQLNHETSKLSGYIK